MSTVTVALDIGGTFTDLVAFDSNSGRLWQSKAATTPGRLVDGIVECLTKAHLDASSIGEFVHGSTIAINTALERSGATVVLVVTAGTRDVYAIGRQNRPDAYDVHFHRPEPLVPRRRVLEVDERMGPDGTPQRPLGDEIAAELVERVAALGAEALAICLLHSYANVSHEARLAGALRAALPGTYVTASHEIVREYREYERTSTTVLNAYVGPRVVRYLTDLEQSLDERAFAGRIFIMQSNGGVMTPATARLTPVAMMESGPVGGIAAAAKLGRRLELADLVAFDMGGTTAKASLVTGYEPAVSQGYHIGGYASGQPLMLPVVDVVEVGTGGGSIAGLDEVGALRVGPQSAGGFPGPVAYGWGGTHPTVTDANLVLGRLGPSRFLGGEMPLDVDGAARAVAEEVAGPLGMDLAEAAWGIVELAMSQMALAVRAVSVERGYDPRDFAMVAFGGAGPLHACGIARELHIPSVVVPLLPGHFSAFGMVGSDFRHDLVRTVYRDLEGVEWASLRCTVAELEEEGLARLESEGVEAGAVVLEAGLDLRYAGQEFALTTPLDAAVLAKADRAAIAASFAGLHHKRYGHSAPTEAVELVNVRVVARAARPEPRAEAIGGAGAKLSETRPVQLTPRGRTEDVPIFWRDDLAEGDVLEGPAIVEEYASTTLLWPGDRLTRLRAGELLIEIAAGGDPARR